MTNIRIVMSTQSFQDWDVKVLITEPFGETSYSVGITWIEYLESWCIVSHVPAIKEKSGFNSPCDAVSDIWNQVS